MNEEINKNNQRHDRLLKYSICTILGFAFILFVTWSVFPKDTEVNGVITIYKAERLLAGISLYIAAILLAVAIASVWIKRIPFKLALWLMPLVVFPVCLVLVFFKSFGAYTCHGKIITLDNKEYRFLDSSFLQGQVMVIARLNNRNTFYEEYEKIVWTNGDHPRHFLNIVRPANALDSYGQLYLTSSNILIGVRFANKLYLAYDIDNKRSYGFGKEHIKSLSPFIYINEKDKLHSGDVDDIIKTGLCNENDNTVDSGMPFVKTVKNDLKHPNEKVRALAKQLINQYNPKTIDKNTNKKEPLWSIKISNKKL